MSNSPKRLHFIDWARSIAIILMLQGHFITATFSEYGAMKSAVRNNGTSGNIIFDFWVHLRGMTAPLFFTITGLIFVFLLVKTKFDNPFQNPRVKKGFKRAIQIIVIGYILQLNVKNIPYYLSGRINDRFFAFHVLHCIGFGILLLILVYVISVYVKKIPLVVYLAVLSVCIFGLKTYFKSRGTDYFPSGAPAMIQNIFHGEYSIFPFSPWIGYVMFGGCLGAIFRQYEAKIPTKHFWYRYFIISVLVLSALIGIFFVLGVFFFGENFGNSSYVFFTLMKISLILSLLILIDSKFKFKNGVFTAMGQDTLFIYVFHTMNLYGALIGIGFNTYFSKSLNGFEAIIGAILFVLLFAVLIKLKPQFTGLFNTAKVKMGLIKNDKN